MSTVAVVGPGSVATFFAAHLAAAGRDVLACARRPFDTYVVDSKESPVRAPARVMTQATELTAADAPADWVLVGVKAHQTAGAAAWFARLCGPDTTVVVLQNGVEGEERLRPYCNGATVLPAVVYCGAQLLAPGHIEHYSRGRLILPETPDALRTVELFAGTPATIDPSPAYLTEAWRKLGLNVALNGPTALTVRPMAVMRDPAMADLARALLKEAWAVGRAEGADLDDAEADRAIDGVSSLPGGGGTSMYYDRRDGRPTEHDAIYGAVLRAAARHGIATPLVAAVSALVAAGDPPG